MKGGGKGGKKGNKGGKAVEEDPEKAVDPKKVNLLKGSLTKSLAKIGCFSMSGVGKQGEFSKFSKQVLEKLGEYKKTFGF